MGLTLDGLIASIWGRGNGNQIMAEYEDAYWWSKDGLRLHYRRYPGPEGKPPLLCLPGLTRNAGDFERSEEHTSELQSLLRISYAVFCLKKKNNATHTTRRRPMQ